MENLITIEHANVRRNNKLILKDVDFSINQGEHTAILGPNGAGKSTLLNICSMEIHPLWREDLLIKRFNSNIISKEELRKHIGVVSQLIFDLCNTTYLVKEVVASGIFSSVGFDFHHHVTQEHWQLTDEVLKDNYCLHLADKTMNSLSTGESQRVLLARALVHNPNLLLLDEAASGLDFPSRSHYRKALTNAINKGKTIVMITHELSQILPEINRIILMKDGMIYKIGNKEELLNEEILSQLYGQKVYVAKKNGIYSAWC
ncbi:MAG: ATP-binding cassette domain-containing protein [Sphaerochaetaceae bacterium]|nr:ATP-binding cassette domain-containing protein [Sphaerochaetaceae bacterium]